MNTADENLRVVQQMYGAFGRGDFATFFEGLSPDVRLESQGPQGLPNFGAWQGLDQVGAFFASLAQNEDIHSFEPREFIAMGDQVVVIGVEDATVRSTGRRFEHEFVQVHTLRDGKITRMRLFADTAAVAAAYTRQAGA